MRVYNIFMERARNRKLIKAPYRFFDGAKRHFMQNDVFCNNSCEVYVLRVHGVDVRARV